MRWPRYLGADDSNCRPGKGAEFEFLRSQSDLLMSVIWIGEIENMKFIRVKVHRKFRGMNSGG